LSAATVCSRLTEGNCFTNSSIDRRPQGSRRGCAMAESNQRHRQTLEATVMPAGVRSERLGQILGFILYVATLASGTSYRWARARGSGRDAHFHRCVCSGVHQGPDREEP
jgi:hypothetical protein